MDKPFVVVGKLYINLSNIAYVRFSEGDGSPYAEVYFIAEKNDAKEGNRPLRCTLYGDDSETLKNAMDNNFVT